MSRCAWPAAVILIALAGFFITLDRAPVAWADGVLYASIARSLSTPHPGVPSVLAASPAAVDHLRFYGPVFFQVEALAFRILGFSIASARLTSLLGAILVALAGALLVRALKEPLDRQLWAAALLLLTPELGFSAANGRMDSLAVGLGMLALVVLVRALMAGTAPIALGTTAGLLLGASALTTPRAMVFAAACAVCSLWLAARPGPRRPFRRRLCGSTLAGCGVLLWLWSIRAHGGPVAWGHYEAGIIPPVDVDVALTPTAIRDWALMPWRLISSLAALAGACLALAPRSRTGAGNPHHREAVQFALAVTGLNFFGVLAAFNLTFIFATYFALPLLAVVIATTGDRLEADRRTIRYAFLVLLTLDATIRLGKYGGAAATWAARDPDRIERFVDAHVPDGSDVIGKASLYFYAVEGAGSRMVRAEPYDYADWAVWAPPAAARPRPPGGGVPARRRFFLWPSDETTYPPPPNYVCANRRLVAVYNAPPTDLTWLGAFASMTGVPGYPGATLYELGPSCGAAAHSKLRVASDPAQRRARG